MSKNTSLNTLPELASTLPPTPKTSTQKRRPGKAAKTRRNDAYREKQNLYYEKEIVDKRIAEFVSRFPVDDLFGSTVLPTESVNPPVTVPISFEGVESLVDEVAYEVAQVVKRPNDIPEIRETLALGTALQIQTKMFYANQGNDDVGSIDQQFVNVANVIASRIDHAPLPIASYIDHIGKAQSGDQTIYPRPINKQRSYLFSDFDNDNEFARRLGFQQFVNFETNENELRVYSQNVPFQPRGMCFVFSFPMHPRIIEIGVEREFWVYDPDGRIDPTPNFLRNIWDWNGFRFIDIVQEERVIDVLIEGELRRGTAPFPVERELHRVSAWPCEPRTNLTAPQVVDRYTKLMNDIRARSDRVVTLNLRDGRGTCAQLVGCHEDDGSERTASVLKSIPRDLLKAGGVFRFGHNTGCPLHTLDFAYERCRVVYRGAISCAANKVRARVSKS